MQSYWCHLAIRFTHNIVPIFGGTFSWFLNFQEAGRWRKSAIVAAASKPSTATATATTCSVARHLHAEQSGSLTKCRVHYPWAEQYLQPTSNSGFPARRDSHQVCLYFSFLARWSHQADTLDTRLQLLPIIFCSRVTFFCITQWYLRLSSWMAL